MGPKKYEFYRKLKYENGPKALVLKTGDFHIMYMLYLDDIYHIPGLHSKWRVITPCFLSTSNYWLQGLN